MLMQGVVLFQCSVDIIICGPLTAFLVCILDCPTKFWGEGLLPSPHSVPITVPGTSQSLNAVTGPKNELIQASGMCYFTQEEFLRPSLDENHTNE